MSFNISSLMYLFALVAASLAVLGVWGLLFAGSILYLYLGSLSIGLNRTDIRLGWSPIVAALGIIVLLCRLLVPTVSDPRVYTQQRQSLNSIKQIELALLNYESVHGHFPPAVVRNEQGEPLYSWRVELLPYLDQQTLYSQLHLDEPWNSPHNAKVFSNTDMSLFQSARVHNNKLQPHETNYVAVVGEGTAWPMEGTISLSEVVTNKECSPVNVIEVGNLGIHWAEPRDVTLEQAIDLLTGNVTNQVEFERKVQGYFVTTKYAISNRVVSNVDGRTKVLYPMANRDDARALLTIAGGEDSKAEYEVLQSQSAFHTLGKVIHWDHIVGVVLLVVIVLLPLVPSVRKRVLPRVTREEKSNA
ncbi:DUF1559 family PulG-like putative transporter [Aeoliella mucimassa]|uniref:DUF1559 domain-containing protein n=1 Tax=Aeoliella mucimassa TaxID=2527972 RepID=A0A518AGN5_9BACT|nr:DUF1559 domain-containing protein [Aeoliella mucimassa]QDU53888.1 hypothetical protein Pan181_00660 [Aeoliella mucimassa]